MQPRAGLPRRRSGYLRCVTQVLDDRYEIGARIGSGGAASVHRAVDRRLGREVAVKLLDDLAASQADPAGRDRFVREARTAAQLHHPHVVTVFDAGEADGQLFLVMQLVEGVTLAELIARRAPLPTDDAARLTIQILGALDAAHRHDIVHRDVKPANVIVDANGDAHLTDFGIAWRLDDIEDHLTSAGRVIGTPTYLAPEQATGGALGAATDVYLAALVLDEMLTGRRTHGETPGAATAAQLAARADPFDPRDVLPGTDDRLADVVIRATDPDPARRFASAHEMILAIVGRDIGSSPAPSRAVVGSTNPPTATLMMPAHGAAATEVMAGAPGEVALAAGAPETAIAAQAPPDPAEQANMAGIGRRSAWRGWLPVIAVAAALLLFVVVAAAAGNDETPSTPPQTTPPATVTTPVTVPPTTVAPLVDDDGGGGGGRGGNNGNNGNGRGNNGNGGGNGNGRGNGG